ncbi:MAG: glycosyltransferase family 2 protein [Sphingomonadales bacterium]|nr:glycosyltransferase family 2 protein [Sphingomonadales bacterium]
MRLSCVIPAYNEAPRIARVLASVVGHPMIDEVIVVDDGSADGTAEVVAGVSGVRLIRLPENRGKTFAVATGIEAAAHDLVMLLDSDLIGLAPEHLAALAAPVREGRADVSISLRRNAPGLWRAIGLDYISGERVLRRDWLLAGEGLRALPRFGLEVHMNRMLIGRAARIAVVHWPEVESPFKHTKFGLWAGLRADARMMRDIFRTVPAHRAALQIVQMRRLRVAAEAAPPSPVAGPAQAVR